MFSEVVYYVFLTFAATVYYFLPTRFRAAVLFLFGASFYAYYAGTAVYLLLGLCLVTWPLLFLVRGSVVLRTGVSIALTLGVLIYYKYSGFFASVVGTAMLNVPLIPLALSFFTFELIHVAMEVRRGHLQKLGLMDYLAFIFFFPTMLAGPIKRLQHFEPGVQASRIDANDVLEGVVRISLGLVKKLVIADNLSTLITEIGQPRPGAKPALLLFAVVLYGFRIYFDFAGYSDIAIGSARLFRIRVPENFLFPYRQKNIAAFWRNWHVSLTNWLVDYVFIPLGGSRFGIERTCANLLLVMCVSGLWHGAAWNFVLWGIWHGLLLVIHRLYRHFAVPRLPSSVLRSRLTLALSYGTTMLAVWIGWAMFMWPIESVFRFARLLVGT